MYWTLLIAVFLAGAFIGMLALFVIGIRREERHVGACHAARITRTEAATRRALGVYVRKSAEPTNHEDTGW